MIPAVVYLAAGAGVVLACLLRWPRPVGRFLLAFAAGRTAFCQTWRRRPRQLELTAPRRRQVELTTARPLTAIQAEAVSALCNYGMKKPEAETLIRAVGPAGDVTALVRGALQRRKGAAA